LGSLYYFFQDYGTGGLIYIVFGLLLVAYLKAFLYLKTKNRDKKNAVIKQQIKSKCPVKTSLCSAPSKIFPTVTKKQ
jgi:hypothetical protein